MIRQRRRLPAPRFDRLECRTLLSLAADLPLTDGPSIHYDVNNSVLVGFSDGGAAAARSLARLDAHVVERFASGSSLIALTPQMDPTAALTQIQQFPGVLYAQANQTIHAAQTPNDPDYTGGLQYALTSPTAGIDASTGWNFTTGDPSVVVAVTDSGINLAHPDLYLKVAINQNRIPATIHGLPSANIVHTDGQPFLTMAALNSLDAGGNVVKDGLGNPINAAYTVDSNSNSRIDGADLLADPAWAINNGGSYVNDIVGYNFVANTNNPTDDLGHGTFVSGIIGASTNNGIGIAGVSWGARILPLKFLDASGNGSVADAVRAIDYAADYGARVINASWGDTSPSPAVRVAVQYAATKNSVFIAAAGNNGQDITTHPFYPAGYREPNQITVASTNSSAGLSGFSNYSSTLVDMAAPGEGIRSTNRNGGYSGGSGTSFAAPQVAGAAALVMSMYPSLTAAQVVQRIVQNTRPLASLNGKTITGGILDLGKALSPASAVVGDFSFEQVSAGPPGLASSFVYGPTGSAWTFSNSAGIAANGSLFTSGNGRAPSGSQVAFLQNQGQFSQSVAFPAGQYTVSFQAVQRSNLQRSPQSFDVLVDGVAVSTFQPFGRLYRSYATSSFTLAAGMHTITFRGKTSAGSVVLIDAIKINPLTE